MKEEGEYLHGFVSADEDESQLLSSPSSSLLLLFGGSRQMMRGSSSSSSLCSQSSVDSDYSAHSHGSHSSMGSHAGNSRRRRRRRRRSSTTSAASGGHSTFQNSNGEESAPTLTPRSGHHYDHDANSDYDKTRMIPLRASHDAGSQEEESVAKMLHGVSLSGGGLFSSASSSVAACHSPDSPVENGNCSTSDERSSKDSVAGGQLGSSVGLSSLTGPSATSSTSSADDDADSGGGQLLLSEASKSSKKKKSNTNTTGKKKKKKLGMNTVIRPVDVRTATCRREGRPPPKSSGGILRHSSSSYGRNNAIGSSSEEGEGSSSSDDDKTTSSSSSSSSSSSIRSQASGSTLSSLSVQSASRVPKTYRHNQSRLLSTDPGSSSSSSPSSSSATDDASTTTAGTDADRNHAAAERRGSWGHMTHHAVYHRQVNNDGYSSSSTLDSSPYYHTFHIPMPSSDSPHLSRTMFGTSGGSNSRANPNNHTNSTMYRQLQTTARHMQQGWKPFLQTPSGHILTRPDYAAIDSEDRPLSRSGSLDTFSVSSLPTIQTIGNASAASASTKMTRSTTTTTTADITVSDEVFTYYGSFRGFLAGLLRRFYYAPLCKLLRRPSFPHHVSPTVDRPPLVRDDTPPRQRLVRSIRNGAEFVHITAAYQWQRHSKLLVLSGMLMAVTYMLSYVPLYESTISPQVAQAGGNVGDEFGGTVGGGERNDYSSPSSAGYQRKVAQLGLVDPNHPSSILATSTTEGGDQTTAIMAGGYYTIPKEYQILMPSSMGGGASPATNLVRLGPLANIAYVTEPIRENDVPIFWHISRAGGSTLKHVVGQCLGMVISSDYGSKMNLLAEDHLRVVTADHGGKYVNVDTSTVAGIDKARSMGLVESNMAEGIVTQYLYQAASLFNVNQQGC